MPQTPLFSVAVLLMICGACSAGEVELSTANWRDEAATKIRLTPAQTEQLARDKVLVSNKEVEQSFAAYTQSRISTLVTSDAVLSGYHVLFEESWRVLEENNAMEMAVHLPVIWSSITNLRTADYVTGDEVLIQSAWTRSRFVIGVAHKLLGGDLSGAPLPLRTAIEAEAARIEQAEGRGKPALLGPPDPDFIAFDYAAFKPEGLYASTLELQRYFRATRWLQRVPFRSERRDEYLAYYLLGVMYPLDDKAANVASLWVHLRANFFHRFFGTSSPWQLGECNERSGVETPVKADDAFFNERAETLRRRVSFVADETTPWPNDRERKALASQSNPVEFRILPPATWPEDPALEALRQVGGQGRAGGLELNAWLGIDSARKSLEPRVLQALDQYGPRAEDKWEDFPDTPKWWQVVEHAPVSMKLRGAWHGLVELDPRAPDFMRSAVWQKKTLNTVAASWVQDRHTWTVPLKPSVITLLAVGRAPGLVEPVPEFYLRMSWIAAWMAQEIAEVEIYRSPVPARIREAQKLAEKLRAKARLDLSEDERAELLWDAASFLAEFDFSHGVQLGQPPNVERVLAAASELDVLARDLATEGKPGGRLWRQMLLTTPRLEPLWKEMEVLCLRLAMIADKQLAGKDLTPEEGRIILLFGLRLSQIMLYEAAAPSFPVDDSPKVACLSSQAPAGSFFHVATGRPRILYVLYPWKGREVLCQGAILPYHEVEGGGQLDDKAWRKQWPEEEGSRPKAAKWLDDFIPSEGVRITNRRDE